MAADDEPTEAATPAAATPKAVTTDAATTEDKHKWQNGAVAATARPTHPIELPLGLPVDHKHAFPHEAFHRAWAIGAFATEEGLERSEREGEEQRNAVMQSIIVPHPGMARQDIPTSQQAGAADDAGRGTAGKWTSRGHKGWCNNDNVCFSRGAFDVLETRG